MFDHVLVPLDGSETSARALRPAAAIAHYLGAELKVHAYHGRSDDGFDLHRVVKQQVEECGDVQRSAEIGPLTKPVAQLLDDAIEPGTEPLVVMSTRGLGRTAGLVGSVATDVLALHHPVMLIGPECDVGKFRLHGNLLLATDASPCTRPAMALAAEAVKAFDYEPVLVNVIEPADAEALMRAQAGAQGHDMVPETAMVHRFAQDLGHAIGHPLQDFAVLHDKNPGHAIVTHASEVGARLIVMATHARSGVRRMALGSVTASVVAHAPCPVLAVAPEL